MFFPASNEFEYARIVTFIPLQETFKSEVISIQVSPCTLSFYRGISDGLRTGNIVQVNCATLFIQRKQSKITTWNKVLILMIWHSAYLSLVENAAELVASPIWSIMMLPPLRGRIAIADGQAVETGRRQPSGSR